MSGNFRERFQHLRPALVLCAGIAFLLASFAVGACGDRAPDVEGLPETVDFNFHVKPILSDRCFACHGPDDAARKADLRLDTEEGAFAKLESGNRAVVPGKPGQSAVVDRILTSDPAKLMPPVESHLTLSDYEKAVLVRWIEQGAKWKPHWSFIPPEKPAVPEVRDANWPENAIDRFILAELEAKGWTPSPEANKETLIRRVTFDLTGLPPTIEEIDAFLADTSPDAYEKIVDRLLASPAYGERMASQWLDIARYADSHGYQDDGWRTMWPYRDWVISAFNRNLSFDDFITWQLAGDLLPNPTREQLLATAFNRNHMQSQEGGIVPEEYRTEYVADRVNTFGRAFLGISTECARCHDHKYDPILQKEYFQLFAFFNSVNETGQIPYSGEPSPTVILTDSIAEAKLAALRPQIKALEAQTDIHAAAYDEGYTAWLERLQKTSDGVSLQPPGLIAHLPLDQVNNFELVNTANRSKPAFVGGDRDRMPETVPGKFGQAQRLVGDSHIDMGGELAYFERNEPFSIGIWFRIEKDSVSGPLFTRSGGLFNGNRGYEVMLREDGTFTAGLHHVFPDNSIEVETVHPVTIGSWHQLVMTYDGSSRAEGIRLFLDGQQAQTRITVDNLHQSILHNVDGGNWGGGGGLRIGRRFEETLQDVTVDEFRVYDRQLTALEVLALSGQEERARKILTMPDGERSKAQQAALREHYVLRVDRSRPAVFARLTKLRGEENQILSTQPEVMIMRDRKEPRPTFLLARGAYDAPAERVSHGTPQAIKSYPEDLPRNRLGLARWLLDPKHPLTARVIVNRYWQMLFGRGIVATPGDFGNQGELPSHPELLDYLATTFVESGWDLKALQKQMVMSATYRQSSVADAKMLEADPENVWLARGPSYRMPAEMIRDNALAASGLLVRKIGGPSVYPYQPPGLWEELATRNATSYVQGHGEDLYRRSLYTIWKRTSPPPSMISFDSAERLFCSVERQRTSTPLQSLVLMNDPQYLEASRMLAERMIKESGPSIDERITLGFRLLTSRRPREKELELLRTLYEDEVAEFRENKGAALKLLSVGEYPRDEQLDPAETAALAMVASTIVNYDEAVNKR